MLREAGSLSRRADKLNGTAAAVDGQLTDNARHAIMPVRRSRSTDAPTALSLTLDTLSAVADATTHGCWLFGSSTRSGSPLRMVDRCNRGPGHGV